MYNKKNLLKKLSSISELKIKIDEPLNKYTSMKVGGPADFFLIPENINALRYLLKITRDLDIPVFIMGKGSNLIAGDKGFKGIIIHMVELNKINIQKNIIIAESGITLTSLAQKALEKNLSGLEFASGIPGTLGGALCMNAGAYGDEMKDIVKESTLVDYSGNKMTFNQNQLNFSYRNSILQKKPLISVSVKLQLKFKCKQKIKSKMTKLNQNRKEKQPLQWPSAGSTFKRPPGKFAGVLIEKAGLKGMKVGDAQVSRKHAGFIINRGQATAQDVRELIKKVQNSVFETSGILLEPEPKFIGDFS